MARSAQGQLPGTSGVESQVVAPAREAGGTEPTPASAPAAAAARGLGTSTRSNSNQYPPYLHTVWCKLFSQQPDIVPAVYYPI